jgi:hypothetical protein
MDAVPAGQVTVMTRWDASAYVVRGSQAPPSTAPVPPVPEVPAVPVVPAAPSGLTSELLLEHAPASASSAATANILTFDAVSTMNTAPA